MLLPWRERSQFFNLSLTITSPDLILSILFMQASKSSRNHKFCGSGIGAFPENVELIGSEPLWRSLLQNHTYCSDDMIAGSTFGSIYSQHSFGAASGGATLN
jgi:hypothetical protein